MRRSYEEQIADYDAQLARIRARRQAAMARYGKAERKARTHALCVLGGMVERCFEGGWKTIDWQGLSSLVENNSELFAQRAAEALPTQEASRRLREWERMSREGADDDDADATQD